MNLPALTWAEAERRHLATARGFTALNIPPGTIRRWAHEQRITAIAKAPRGAHLYDIAVVSEVAETLNHRPTAKGPCK